MSTHKIDITISAEDAATIRGHVTGLVELCSALLVGMDDRDRRRLRRMGGKSEQFVREALALAKANGLFIPQSIDLAALDRDKAAYELLLPLFVQLAALTKLMGETVELLGSDMMYGALDSYKALKSFGKAAGLEELVKDLGKGFARPRRKKDNAGQLPVTVRMTPIVETTQP